MTDNIDRNNQRFKSQARLASLEGAAEQEKPKIRFDSPVLLGILMVLFLMTSYRALKPSVHVEEPPSKVTLTELKQVEDHGTYLEGKCTNGADRGITKVVFQVFFGKDNPPMYVVVVNLRPGEARAFRSGPFQPGVYAAASGSGKGDTPSVVPLSVDWKS